MRKRTLRNYARLLARMGVGVKKGDAVIITAELDAPEFVEMCVEECYKAGAEKVMVDFTHQPLQKYNVKYRSLKTLSTVEEFEKAKLQYKVDRLPATLYLVSADPDGLCDIDQEKNAKAMRERFKVIKPYRDQMDNKYKWCIAAVPGAAWAKKVFPGERKSVAIEKLWNAILYTSRVIDKEGNDLDPIAEWNKHNANFEEKSKYLNDLGIKTLHYTSANGTDLKVGLIKDGIFCGGGETTLGKGEFFNPNIPSEEIFTSPKAGEAEGIVYSSMPLSYNGGLIENFNIRFENGKAVEVHAEKGEDILKQIIGMDENAGKLGECALVPFESPIRQSGVTFCETLFDENAVCHLALGRGFDMCIKDYDKYTKDELKAKGINDSFIHVDFMIGTADLKIEAETFDGRTVTVFENGTWKK